MDASRFGIPEPDDVIDFEDLMIFAMNWGNVDPLGTSRYLTVESPAELKERVSFKVLADRARDDSVADPAMLLGKKEAEIEAPASGKGAGGGAPRSKR